MSKQVLIFSLLILASCGMKNDQSLSSIQIIDRNGMNETISAKEKLDTYGKVDFERPQPYHKIVRVYRKDQEGKIHAKATTYHENGHIYQYLELVNGRAHGLYKEWFPNGVLRMQAGVMEGIGDLTESAQASWIFNQQSMVWNEDGCKIAEIYYDKGSLEGVSKYFHPNGKLSKVIPYLKDKIHGKMQIFDEAENVIGETDYFEGLKHGVSIFKGGSDSPPREEIYQKGFLLEGKYYNYNQELVSEIHKGFGTRAVFTKGVLKSEHEYRHGIPEGQVYLYREDGSLESKYFIRQGKKEGQEWNYYYPSTEEERKNPAPMLCIDWQNDEIHGVVKTWYVNGKLESEREMNHNKKQGMAIAWYRDGSLMLIEEYENDLLVAGKYLKKGEEDPFSRVVGGSGLVTLFGPDGDFLRKVEYRKGKPVEQ